MGVISFRVTDEAEKQIKNGAEKRGMTISQFVACELLEETKNFQDDNFLIKHKICEIEKNQQEIIQALFEMTKRIRLGANVSISILEKLDPSGYLEKIADIEKSVEAAIHENRGG